MTEAALLSATFDGMRQGVLVLDAALTVSFYNRRLADLAGFPPDLLRDGAAMQSLVAGAAALGQYPGQTGEKVYGDWLARLARLEETTHRLVLADGRIIEVNQVPMMGGGWVITYEDVTHRARVEEALERRNQHLDAAVSNAPHGLCMFDEQKRLILCNAPYGRMYSLPAELLQAGTPLQSILDYRASVGNAPIDVENYFDVVVAAQQEKCGITIRRIELEDGRTVQITHNQMPTGYVATHEDVTGAIRAEAQIRHMAGHDALTGLPNRTLLHEMMARMLAHPRRGESIAVLCLDLDHFKAVNDTLGHPIGDVLLKAVADRLRNCVRDMDVIARLGGDEFVIVHVGIEKPEQAGALARRLVEVIAEPFDLDGNQVVVGTSIGIAVSPTDGGDSDKLLKHADMALHRAKADGRGTYRFFELAMDAFMQQRRQLELDLRRALVREEFRVFYQPIVDARSEEIIGFEALLRWQHPTRGLVSPADFIPLAEEIGLIVPLGEWVIRQACTDAAQWPSDIKVAINLSPIQFRSHILVDRIVSALADSGLSPGRLEVEITESVLLAESETTLATLHHLRRLGVRIAMDDFGTGYSSLSYLRSFPFDKIKIDKSFILGLSDESDASVIVKAIVDLGLGLGMTTTAEGVETAELLERVQGLGCIEVQGYYFSAARPVSEVAALLGDRAGSSGDGRDCLLSLAAD